MNEIMKPDQTAARLLAVANEEQAVGGVEFIRFLKTDFFIGDVKVTGNEYLAHVSQLLRGYVKFGGDGIVERRVGKVADGFVLPQRSELGELTRTSGKKMQAASPATPGACAGACRSNILKQAILPCSRPAARAASMQSASSADRTVGIPARAPRSSSWCRRAIRTKSMGQSAFPTSRLWVGSRHLCSPIPLSSRKHQVEGCPEGSPRCFGDLKCRSAFPWTSSLSPARSVVMCADTRCSRPVQGTVLTIEA